MGTNSASGQTAWGPVDEADHKLYQPKYPRWLLSNVVSLKVGIRISFSVPGHSIYTILYNDVINLDCVLCSFSAQFIGVTSCGAI
jgi:hypothetical protein